jgi:hypothetical protein
MSTPLIPITINGTAIKTPTTFQPEKYPLTKGGRTTDGSMQLEFVADKRKFTFKYAGIKGSDWFPIAALLSGSSNLFLILTFPENGATGSATVYRGAVKTVGTLLHVDEDPNEWVYTDIEFSLIEQ